MTTATFLTLVDAPEHLPALYESLNAQTIGDWEWLVVPLGMTVAVGSIFEDERVRLVHPPQGARQMGEGACKKIACDQAVGDFIIEVDQHDVLAANALEVLCGAATAFEAGLVYCDFVDVSERGGFDAAFGWDHYDVLHSGERFRAVRAFDPSPSSLGQASYVPRHGLCWRRSEYERLGGHHPGLGNTDSFDLVCRAYVAGVEFAHVNECLVFSRQDAYRKRDLAEEARLAADYQRPLIEEWCRREGLLMLDLGAAHNPEPGFQSVDLHDADFNCDIRDGLPVPDGSVGCIRAADFLEHMNHCPDSACDHERCIVGVMNGFYRSLAPGGWLITHTPSTDGRGAFQDPTHTSFWNPNSFWYYTRADQARFVPGIRCRFQAARVEQGYPSKWAEENDVLYVDADLVALKGQRQPGPVLI